jgi:hypothetical protein
MSLSHLLPAPESVPCVHETLTHLSQATHIGQKIRHQELYRLEDIPFLVIPNGSMVALASLIVIAHETCPLRRKIDCT